MYLGQIETSCTDRICQNILENLSPGILRTYTGALLIFSTIPSYILILTPAREHIEGAALKMSLNLSIHIYFLLYIFYSLSHFHVVFISIYYCTHLIFTSHLSLPTFSCVFFSSFSSISLIPTPINSLFLPPPSSS